MIEYSAAAFNKLASSIQELIHAADDLKNAKQSRDREGREQAEKDIEEAAKKAVRIDHNLASLYLRACHFEKLAPEIQKAWKPTVGNFLKPQDITFSHIPSDLASFPPGSWTMDFTFKLLKPYISQDDTDFYIIDNPVKKEWVFKVPYVAPSQWKGALRAAMTRQLVLAKDELNDDEWVDRRLQLVRLFGNEKSVGLDDAKFEGYLDGIRPESAKGYREHLIKLTKTGYYTGCLHFYPTYFDKLDLEVINPHDRKTGAGTRPIYFESVPQNTDGRWGLLYVPLYGPHLDTADILAQAGYDLQAVSAGVNSMMTEYGFGAKTGSGFGQAESTFPEPGTLIIRAELSDKEVAPAAQPEPQQPALPRYLESPTRLHADFRNEEDGLKTEDEYKKWLEARGKKYNKKATQLYDKAKKWWASQEQERQQGKDIEAEQKQDSEPVISPVIGERTFSNFSELMELAQELAVILAKEGKA